MPAVTVLVRVLYWLDFWRCWCFRWRGCRWRWFWVRVGGGPDRLGAVVGQCWVAFCVGLLLVRVSYVLVFWWVLGSLVLPMVPPLVSGVSAGEGVVASGLGVGGGAGVGVVVPGPGVGRGRSDVTGCGRSPLLAAGLVGPPLRGGGANRQPDKDNKDKNGGNPNPNPGGNSEPSGGQSGPTTRSQTQAQQEQGAKREHEGGDDGNAKKRSRFMRMARKLRNKGFEVTCPAEF